MRKRRINSCHNVMDFRKLAKKRLPAPMFHYIDGAAEDEWTYRQNTSAFDKYELVPRFLVDVESIDTSTTVLGQKIDWPFICSPTGYHRLFHHDGEKGAARAADRTGTIFCLSTLSSTTIEDVSGASSGPKVFQIYVLKDRGLSVEYIERCKEADYSALCLTVDVPTNGRRERDLRTGMTVPPKLGVGEYLDIARHLGWTFNYLTHPPTPSMVNIEHRVPKGSSDISVMDFMNSQFDRTVTWKDAEWMIGQWDKPFAIKGILSVEDAKKAVDIGASAIMISNHGGRQMDGCPAPIEVLADIVDAVGDKIEVIMDGGVRRGTHILKALSMGAKACMGGRAYLYGLAAAGEEGAYRSLNLLKEELTNNMILLGTNTIEEVSSSELKKV